MWALALAVRPGTMWALAALALVALGDRPGQDYHSFYHSGRGLATVTLALEALAGGFLPAGLTGAAVAGSREISGCLPG